VSPDLLPDELAAACGHIGRTRNVELSRTATLSANLIYQRNRARQ